MSLWPGEGESGPERGCSSSELLAMFDAPLAIVDDRMGFCFSIKTRVPSIRCSLDLGFEFNVQNVGRYLVCVCVCVNSLPICETWIGHVSSGRYNERTIFRN